MKSSDRYLESQRIALLGGVKNAFLSIIKIVFGITGHSHALLADGLHSLSDLLIDGLVLIASRVGSKAADEEHPYGHGRIETAATVLLSFILSVAGIAIIYDAGKEIFSVRVPTPPDFYVLLIALFSVLINEGLYRYTRFVGEKLNSNLLITNAWHHRSDSASSLVVLIGAGGAWLGFYSLDAIAAVIVGAMIIKMAWQFGLTSVRELVDTAQDESVVEQIKKIMMGVSGVRAVHQLRTRTVGGAIFLDVHVLVDPTISVSEGHFISQQVHFQLMREISKIADVTVHIDPEDDETMTPSRDLPTRDEIKLLLQERWKNFVDENAIEKIVLHYLGGKVFIEIRLPLIDYQHLHNVTNRLREKLHDWEVLGEVKVVFI
jgi:cation diffusion facilitator family transporter